MCPLRVVLVASRFWPQVGGREKNLAQLGVELAARQHQVTVWTACWQENWPRQVVYRGVQVVRQSDAPRDRWSTMRYLSRLGRWLRRRRNELDVVCVSGLAEEARTAVRSLAGKAPVVLRADPGAGLRPGRSISESPAGCWRRFQRACRRADAVVAPSGIIYQQLLAEGYSPQRVCHIAPGVRILPPPSAEARRAARRTLANATPVLHLADDWPLAVYLGRLADQPELAQLIAAWSRVVRQHPESRLWLVGPATAPRGLEDQIEAQRLGGRVLLVGAFDQVDDILAAADWLVQPLADGGLGLAVLEAMAAGLPVIACDTPEHRELLADGACGLLVQRADADALADAALRLAADPVLRLRLGTLGRERAMTCFSLQRQTEEYCVLFHRLVAHRHH